MKVHDVVIMKTYVFWKLLSLAQEISETKFMQGSAGKHVLLLSGFFFLAQNKSSFPK